MKPHRTSDAVKAQESMRVASSKTAQIHPRDVEN